MECLTTKSFRNFDTRPSRWVIRDFPVSRYPIQTSPKWSQIISHRTVHDVSSNKRTPFSRSGLSFAHSPVRRVLIEWDKHESYGTSHDRYSTHESFWSQFRYLKFLKPCFHHLFHSLKIVHPFTTFIRTQLWVGLLTTMVWRHARWSRFLFKNTMYPSSSPV